MRFNFIPSRQLALVRGLSSHFISAYPPFGIGLSLALCSLAPTANAARPMVADDARIVDAKACQLESWVKKNRNSTEYWALPACNFTGNLELTMGGARTHDDTGTHTTDIVFQSKALFSRVKCRKHWRK